MKKRFILLSFIIAIGILLVGCNNSKDENIYVDFKKAEISSEQPIGADMVNLDYASDDIIVFHDYFGLFIYSINEGKIISSIDLEDIDCNKTQGDESCEVSVSNDGKIVQLHNISSEYMYVYSVEEQTLMKIDYISLNNSFKLVKTKDIINQTESLYSYGAVKFQDGDFGYLALKGNTINSLEYIRGNKRIKVFNEYF